MNLCKADAIILIQEYEKQRILWDSKHKWHFKKNKKNDAWNVIAKRVNIDVEDAKKKMASLLGSLRREKAKGRKTMGTGGKQLRKSDWFAFNSFAFLMDEDELRKTTGLEDVKVEVAESSDTTPSCETDDMEPTSGSNYTTAPSCITPDLVTDITPTQEVAPKSFVKPSNPRRKRVKLVEDKKEDPRIKKTFESLQQPVLRDESTPIFGRYLAEKLNQFDATTKAVLIHKINQLIFDAEMSKLGMETVAHCATGLPSPSLSSSSSTHSPTATYEFVNCTTVYMPEDTPTGNSLSETISADVDSKS